jgi:hypothetical protein
MAVCDEELARVEELCMDAARRRIAGESCIRTERIRSALEIGDFVIISAPNDVPEPFYIAQVKFIEDLNVPYTSYIILNESAHVMFTGFKK